MTLTTEQIASAREMLDSGASIAETARATGISPATLYRRFREDPRPGGRKGKRKKKRSATDEQLQSMLRKAAVAPAIPVGLWLQCDFCAQHFVRNGPIAAARLVELSHEEPALRRVLEWLHAWYAEAMWAGILASWLGVPIAHHLAPEWLYHWLQLPMGLPSRNASSRDQHTENGYANANPFADLDLDALLAMANQFGIRVNMNPDDGEKSEETETEDSAPSSAETDSQS